MLGRIKVNHLKLDKNDCIDGLSSDNFKKWHSFT